MFIGAGGVLLNVTLNLLLINSLEYVGLALATSISAWVQATVLGIFLKKKRLFFFSTQLSNYIRKLSIPVLVLVAYLTVLVPSFELFIKKIAPSSWILLPAILGPGIGLYILFAAWVGIFRPSYFKNFSKDL